jgi:diguanylate cyclase (GGDEF)-like protein
MSITSGLWVLTEARLLQYFTGNRFVLGSLAYLMIPIMAFFFSLYIKDAVITQTKYKRHLRYIALSFIGLVIINIILQLLGVLVYIEMMQYTLPIILISAIYASYLIYLEITKHQNNEAKRFIKFTVILLVSLIFEIGSFFFGLFSSISSFFRIGIVIFFVVIAADTFMFIRINMRKRDETLLLEKMAYKDFLTGGFNRSAYERDVQQYIDSNKIFRLILLDLNELKHINDTYGHAQGDEAIRIVFKSMEEAFEFGNKYRIGGDEFAVLMDHEESNRYLNCIEQFHNTLKEKMIEFVYPLNVAIGTDVYINDQWEQFGKFYHHVDQLMYMNKNIIKNKESI